MRALLLAGLMAMIFPAQADVYRCQDTGGKTIYQEAPCEKANLTTVKKLEKPVGEPSPEAIEKAQAESRAMVQRYNERKKTEQESARKETEKAKVQQNTEHPDEHDAGEN
ncbi:MAG: DUF4124 domain-containing protein [Sulfuricella denitrificans]|nr:DUF4124 domain-containing protein [Sulfuricella denitrificans]